MATGDVYGLPVRLGIDLDGVVADFNSGWVRRYNLDFGTELTTDDVQGWDGLHRLTHFRDMGDFWEWAKDHGGGSLFRHLEPYPDAVPALERLSKSHELVILTVKPDWAVHDTFAWIAEHGIPTREVHLTEEKWRVPCDVYLEDSPYQIETIHLNRPESVVCRFVRPWNEPRPGVRDVADWDEFVGLVDGLYC